jgi:protein translocase SEC61 complex gamma subunit
LPYLPKPTVTFILIWNAENAIIMGLRDFLTQCARTLKLAVKPGRSELWLSIKICLLGIGAVGLIGFVIKLLSSVIQPGTSAT